MGPAVNDLNPALPARPLWRRILLHPASLMVIGFLWVAIGEVLPLVVARHAFGAKPAPLVAGLLQIGVALWLILLWKVYKRWIEQSVDGELPWQGAPREWVLGLLFGFALFSVMTGLVALMGGFAITGVRQGIGALWPMLGMAMLSGVSEEMLFRGVLLRQLEKMVGTWGALALTSGFFGAAHLGNPGATWFAALAIAMEAGILLGAAYLLTRRLWLAIGIHSAWNFTQGWIYSVPVSGGKAPEGLFISARHGPEWLTGGAFGLEASAVAMVVATLAGVILLVRVVRKGGIVPPRWVQTKE
ncbi:MAG: CPBP family intramembrane metalloprotease [Sphingomonadales bacterium]|nr:CPBP family intramembrane metalloprotease [Sphingomonadales bacterium]MDE2168578.1 CPBP family intramembrane metalloprotease [Sphingomonadales bacterium]